jgi:Ca2+-binding RTX toxin-like protein
MRWRLTAALATLALPALPAAASAHQELRYGPINPGHPEDGFVIQIIGDADGKPNDTITVSYSKGTGPGGTDEIVMTHDIVDPLPAGCHATIPGPPAKEVRCPATGLKQIKIDAGQGNNTVDLSGLQGSPFDAMGNTVTVDFGDGSNKLVAPLDAAEIDGTVGTDPTNTGQNNLTFGDSHATFGFKGGSGSIKFGPNGGATLHYENASYNTHLGDGNDVVDASGGTDGDLNMGGGDDEVDLTTGDSPHIEGGDGNDKVQDQAASAGTPPASHLNFDGGPGDDVFKLFSADHAPPVLFTGDDGNDLGIFGSSVDKFFGGAGNDKAKLGAGNDKGIGGSGNDNLNGGKGSDKLLGGPGRDKLNGGSGQDKCVPAGGGGSTSSCEAI